MVAKMDPRYSIRSEEQARNWILEQVGDVEIARRNTLSCLDAATTKHLYKDFMLRFGQASGALIALHRTGLLTDTAYEQLKLRLEASMAPRMVG